MFTKRSPLEVELDGAINEVYRQLAGFTTDEEGYEATLSKLERLYKIRDGNRDRVSKDTLAIVAANLLGIVLIVGYEQKHVITSKALNFVLKSR